MTTNPPRTPPPDPALQDALHAHAADLDAGAAPLARAQLALGEPLPPHLVLDDGQWRDVHRDPTDRTTPPPVPQRPHPSQPWPGHPRPHGTPDRHHDQDPGQRVER